MGRDLYHHGDLKKEMIQKGLQLLNKEGFENFSLRKLAAMCNVSHTAPYRHFKNKKELYGIINAEISTKFKEALLDGTELYKEDPRKRLQEVCRHYISFMVENPDYFRYIFLTSHERKIVVTADDIVFTEEDHPFSVSKNYAKEFFERFHDNETDWVLDFISLWSQIHGLTLLLVKDTLRFQGDYLPYADRMIEKYLDLIEKSHSDKM